MVTLCKDLFNGSGNFDGRFPDVGDEYHVFGGPDSQLDAVLLSGDGRVPEYNSFALGGPVSSAFTRSAGDQLLTVLFEALHDDTFVDFQVELTDTDSSISLVTTQLVAQNPGWQLFTTVIKTDTTILYSNGVDVSSNITGSPQTLTVEVTGSGVVWKIDGVTVDNSGGAIPDQHPNMVGWHDYLIGTDPSPPVAFYIDSVQYDADGVAQNEALLTFLPGSIEGEGGGVMRGSWGPPSLAGRAAGVMRGSYGAWRIDGRGGAVGRLAGPMGSAFGIGRETSGNRAIIDAPSAWTIDGRAGGVARLTFPTPILLASGTTIDMGTANLIAPMPTLLAHGTPTIMGVAKLVTPMPTILGRGGGAAMLRAPMPTLLASTTVVNVGVAKLVAPMPTLDAHGFTVNVGTAFLVYPVPFMVQTASMRGSWGPPTILALGHDPTDTGYEGWSITLLGGQDPQAMEVAASRYATYPFERIVRFGGRYYGVAFGGIFELGGDLFDTAPIIASVQTAEWDSGTIKLKRYPALYLAGRVGADFDVSLITSELEIDTYNYHVGGNDGAAVHRVRFGKGIRAHYAAYGLRNRNGEDFMIDSIAPELQVLRSAIG